MCSQMLIMRGMFQCDNMLIGDQAAANICPYIQVHFDLNSKVSLISFSTSQSFINSWVSCEDSHNCLKLVAKENGVQNTFFGD